MDAFDDLEAHLNSLNTIAETKTPNAQQQQQQQQQLQQHPAVPRLQYLNKATLMLQQSIEKGDAASCERYRTACHAAIQNLREYQKKGVPSEIDLHIKQAFNQVKPLIVQLQQHQQQTPSYYQSPQPQQRSSPYSSPASSPASSPLNSPLHAHESPRNISSSPCSSLLTPPSPSSSFSSSTSSLLSPPAPASPRRGGSPRKTRKKTREDKPKEVKKLGELAHSAKVQNVSTPHLMPPGSSSFENGTRKKKMSSSGTVREKKGKKDGVSTLFEGLDVSNLPRGQNEEGSGYLTPQGDRKSPAAPGAVTGRTGRVGKSSLRYDSHDEERKKEIEEEGEDEEEDEEFTPDPLHPIFPAGYENEGQNEEEEKKKDGPLIFKALYWHKPPKDEWLSFEAGEIITRIPCSPSEAMAGWEKGVSGSTGKVGLFPIAYVEKMDVKKPGAGGLAAPPAVMSGEQATQVAARKIRRRNPRSSMKNYANRGDLEKRQSMGINADKRASMLISAEIVKGMDFKPKKKEKEEKTKEKEIPECMQYDQEKHKLFTVSIKKPSGDKEKKKQRAEIDAIIDLIAHNDPSCYKVDFSDIKIPYSSLKRLFVAIGKNKRMYTLKLANCGLIASHCQLLEINLTKSLSLRELDLSRNGFGLKEAKILETTVQKCFCLVKLPVFSPEELSKKKDLATAVQNIEWYLQSNVGFLEFYQDRSTELRLCGRALDSTLGWERYKETTLLNASHNYLKTVNPQMGGVMPNLTELNLSHNDLSSIPYSFGQLTSLTCLNLSFNVIKEIPSSLDQCTKMEVLHLNNNKIRHFPGGLLKVSTLREVYAANNKAKIPKDMDPKETIQFLLSKYSKY